MSIADYEGRTIDVLAYDNMITETGRSELEMVFAQPDEGGKIVTGLGRLMQTFVLRLFTIKGSLRYLPDEGCQFMSDARSGLLRTVPDVFSSFSASVADIKDQFRLETRDTDPPDEIFEDAELTNVQLDGDRLQLVITITSAAGTSGRFITPLEIDI